MGMTAAVWCAAAVVAMVTAVSASVAVPNGVHLQITADSRTSIRAMWSLPNTSLEESPSAFCWYGTTATPTAAVPADKYTYTAGGFKGTLYACLMDGLLENTRYFYRVGAQEAPSALFSFRTAPPVSAPVAAILWADMGIQNPVATSLHVQSSAAMDILSGNYTLIINAGDTSYADDYNAEIVDLPNAWVLDRYWHEVEASAANAPMALCPGNHEDQYAFAAHLNRTRMPDPTVDGQAVSGALTRFYFSFDYGCVHFVSISTEHNSSAGSEQWNFVRQDLEAANKNRAQVPWIVFFTHHPFYCSTRTEPGRCGPEMDAFLASYEDLFHQYNVDVFVSGHNHCYERSYPVYKREPIFSFHQPNRTVYVVNGAAGDIEGTQNSWDDNVPWRAAHNEELYTGYSRMMANMTTLSWSYVNAKNGNQITDAWQLTK